MGERYAECRSCAGPECFVCGGSGFSGNALDYLVAQNKEEWEREKKPEWWSLSESSNRLQRLEDEFYKNPPKTPPLEAAVAAFQIHIEKQKERNKMLQEKNLPSTKKETTSMSLAEKFGFTESQLDLIKRTVAKNATDDELELFFYRAKALNLNPLMPGQIFFVKFGNSPGTVITGIDGFRNHAHSTGKLAGVKRGVIRDKNGQCIGGWADVYRSDWKEPAHEEVALSEYDTGKGNWVRMPETMIKKVAEAAAYRMAFPQHLGGLYVSEEMDQAKQTKEVESEIINQPPSEDQIRRLFAIAKDNGIQTKEELKKLLKEWYGLDHFTDLNMEEYGDFCASLIETKPEAAAPEIIKAKDSDITTLEPGSDVGEDLPWAKYREKKTQ